MKLGLKPLKEALMEALTNAITINSIPIPVVGLYPLQAIGEYIHIGNVRVTPLFAKGENLFAYSQTIKVINEYYVNDTISTQHLDSISDQVFEIIHNLSDDAVTGFTIFEDELESVTTNELVGENGKRMAIHELNFSIKLQEN